MTFRKFLTELQSIRDYQQQSVGNLILGEVKSFLDSINLFSEKEYNFSFKLFENGTEVFDRLEGVGGYSGIMIKSPYYIGLLLNDDAIPSEFFGAYYMQSIVKKLYDLGLGSCWINVSNVSAEIKANLLKDSNKNINYLLAFGKAHEKSIKQKSKSLYVQSGTSAYKSDPYGAEIVKNMGSDATRLGLEEIVYLYEWGNEVSYEELENRGLADLFLYVRNAPSYKNKQPIRFILKDGEAYLAVINPENRENITDAGIMMFTAEGMAKDLGIPSKWYYLGQNHEVETGKEYALLAKIEL